EWFVFDGAGTIKEFNWAVGRENVVIPWAIGGVPVTAIGANAFFDWGAYLGFPVTSVIAPQTVTTIGNNAFQSCYLLASVSLPQAQTVGDNAFSFCGSLSSVSLPQAQTVGDNAFFYCELLTAVHMGQNAPPEATGVFAYITPPPTVYVTDPQATGWGAVWNGAPVVRPPLYGDEIYRAGQPVATEAHVAQAIAGKVDQDSGMATNLWLQGETIVSDSYTNLWWRNVYSNGWHWLVAYTNAPGGAQ
ncbi:MAG TPA: leucine-rich repeat domain-containing protein, partial [Lentisphaerae bacterium]|nr:leucine-rich repeat domain-containing protein [Lentisphaerota bacterium]